MFANDLVKAVCCQCASKSASPSISCLTIYSYSIFCDGWLTRFKYRLLIKQSTRKKLQSLCRTRCWIHVFFDCLKSLTQHVEEEGRGKFAKCGGGKWWRDLLVQKQVWSYSSAATLLKTHADFGSVLPWRLGTVRGFRAANKWLTPLLVKLYRR